MRALPRCCGLLLSSLMLAACGGRSALLLPGGGATTNSTGTGGVASVCAPGATQSCTCENGATGTETCNADGSGYGECAGCVLDVPWSKRFYTVSPAAVAADDTVFVDVGLDASAIPPKHLLAIDPSGNIMWDRPHKAWGWPLLRADGTLVYAGHAGAGANDVLGTMVECKGVCAFAAQLDGSGSPVWVTTLSDKQLGVAHGAKLDLTYPASGTAADGRVAIRAHASQQVDSLGPYYKSFVAELSAQGDVLWTRSIAGWTEANVLDAALTPSGDLWLAGTATGNVDVGGGVLQTKLQTYTYGVDAFIARYDAANHVVAQRLVAAAPETVVGILSLAADGAGDALLVASIKGTFDLGAGVVGTPGQTQTVLAKLGPDGSPIFTKLLGDVTPLGQRPAVAAGPDGSIWMCTGSGGEAQLSRYDASGMLLSQQSWGTSGHDACAYVTVGAKGVPVVGGSFQGSIDFGQGPLAAMAMPDGFVAKLGP